MTSDIEALRVRLGFLGGSSSIFIKGNRWEFYV